MAAQSDESSSSRQDQPDHQKCIYEDKSWLNIQRHPDNTIMKPHDLQNRMTYPPNQFDKTILDRIHGSMIGMALGDALGAHVEFRPHAFLVENPVTDLVGGGTWGLEKGQFTDDTSMALCLASSLIVHCGYNPYDQLVRYKWWFREGYMSSTGQCFDIGSATKQSLVEFERRQKQYAKKHDIPRDQIDILSYPQQLKDFDVNCSTDGVAGNGALMRLAPVPLFFYRVPSSAVEYSGYSGEITHGDRKAVDACRYYGALIIAAINGESKEKLLDESFYDSHKEWFNNQPLDPEIQRIARGLYKQKEEGYEKGIRGKGYIVHSLEAALWAFCFDENSFEKGVLMAINLGDDTDTTAAIYGQLAGAHYGYDKLPKKWVEQVYAKEFIQCLSQWITYEGSNWSPDTSASSTSSSANDFEKTSRPRSVSTVNPPCHLKVPESNKQSGLNRPKSVEHLNSTNERQRIYIHGKIKTADDVLSWLVNLNKNYSKYANDFKCNRAIDGYWLLNQVDDKKLIKYGVKQKDDRQAILDGIEKLKEKCPEAYAIQT